MKIIETIICIPLIAIYICTLCMFSVYVKFPSGNTFELGGWLM